MAGGARQARWGFVSDASYVPFHSPDGVTNIDLHVEPDAWPLPLGLPADDATVPDVRRKSHDEVLVCVEPPA